VSVEAELGTLGGIEEDISGHVKLTDPDQAVDFVCFFL
jgi:fructose/tagatose bisphosphate aldolase